MSCLRLACVTEDPRGQWPVKCTDTYGRPDLVMLLDKLILERLNLT